jgi:threonine/homoserine/homoserine lactone efflux protein
LVLQKNLRLMSFLPGNTPMNLFFPIATLLGALAVGAISPGPSFVFVARTSVAGSRGEGLAAAVGMGIGAVIFAILVMLGLHALLASVGWLYFALKAAGALYLIYMGIGLWKGAGRPFVEADEAAPVSGSPHSSFLRALLTQLSNPKALVVYGSIFAALLPPDLPRSASVILPFLVFMVEAGWYSIVALALSSATPRRAYLRCKTGIDRVAGGVLGLLGLKLLLSADSPR